MYRQVGDDLGVASALVSLGDVLVERGRLGEALRLALDAHGVPWTTDALLGLANLALEDGDAARAARFAGAVRSSAHLTRWHRERADGVLVRAGVADALERDAPTLFEVARSVLDKEPDREPEE